MDIQYFHQYRRLSRRGLVKPLACDHCSIEYTLRATESGEPVLQCFRCDTLTQPGLNMYDNIRSVVREHFE